MQRKIHLVAVPKQSQEPGNTRLTLGEYIADKPVNTDIQLIGAAVEAFLRLGADSVTVAEGPGHHRDTELLLFETGLGDHLVHRKVRFVDLNRDGLAKVKLQALFGTRPPMASADRPYFRLHRVDAKSEDASLDRRDFEHEKHVRNCSRLPLRLAEKCPPLGRNP